MKKLRVTCASCRETIEVDRGSREFKACECGKTFVDGGDGYCYRVGGCPVGYDLPTPPEGETSWAKITEDPRDDPKNMALNSITEAISMIEKLDKKREHSLAITKLEEAYMWLNK